jgi:hypothetical protein
MAVPSLTREQPSTANCTLSRIIYGSLICTFYTVRRTSLASSTPPDRRRRTGWGSRATGTAGKIPVREQTASGQFSLRAPPLPISKDMAKIRHAWPSWPAHSLQSWPKNAPVVGRFKTPYKTIYQPRSPKVHFFYLKSIKCC